jgi:hypothetical protein
MHDHTCPLTSSRMQGAPQGAERGGGSGTLWHYFCGGGGCSFCPVRRANFQRASVAHVKLSGGNKGGRYMAPSPRAVFATYLTVYKGFIMRSERAAAENGPPPRVIRGY